MRLCSIDNCGREHDAHGYCKIHYERYRRGKEIHAPIISRTFYVAGDECILRNCTKQAVSKNLCVNHNAITCNYGLTTKQYIKMHEDQDYKCAICKKEPSGKFGLVVDHNHETDRIRGLLCSPCNKALGHVREDVQVLKNAIRYIQLWG